MIECRTCREVFRMPPEKLGARCPNCRMPLFERSDRPRSVEGTGMNCGVHEEVAAVGRCGRCGQLVCANCRSRWYDQALCLSCAERAMAAGDLSPKELARRELLVYWSVGLAVLAWGLLLLTLIPLVQLLQSQGGAGAARTAQMLFFLSLIPNVIALGQAALALRVRARRLALAVSSLVLAGLQIGLMAGVLLIHRWHN